MTDATTATTTTAADTTTATTTTATTTTPWYQGKVDAELIGHWDNKAWDKSDPVKIAIEATKQAREAQKHFGVPPERLIKIPENPADEAGWKGVYSRLGVPNEAKEYDLASVKFADGSDLDDGFVAPMRDALLAARVPKDRAGDVVKAVVKFMDGAEASEKAERAAKIAAEKSDLQKNWGTNFERNKLHAMDGARRLGADPAMVDLLEQHVGYSKVMEMFRRVGAATDEATFVEGRQGGHGNPATLEGAIARKQELMADHAWVTRYLAKGAAEVREMNSLNALISAGMPTAA